jgi:hypothetical protein
VFIYVNFLIIGVTINWCHSFTKLIWTRGKFTTYSLLNILFCFVFFYLLFYSSYILRRWLQTTHQPNSLTTSSIAPEEAQTMANLICKRRCNLWILNNVILCVWIWICGCWCCVWMNYICECECECCLWILWTCMDLDMNVDVYVLCMDKLYMWMWLYCAGFKIPDVELVVFYLCIFF